MSKNKESLYIMSMTWKSFIREMKETKMIYQINDFDKRCLLIRYNIFGMIQHAIIHLQDKINGPEEDNNDKFWKITYGVNFWVHTYLDTTDIVPKEMLETIGYNVYKRACREILGSNYHEEEHSKTTPVQITKDELLKYLREIPLNNQPPF